MRWLSSMATEDACGMPKGKLPITVVAIPLTPSPSPTLGRGEPMFLLNFDSFATPLFGARMFRAPN